MKSYRQFYDWIKLHYPYFENKYNPPSYLKSLSEIPELYSKFKKLTDATDYDIRKNRNNLLLLFVAIITKMEDPLFFDFSFHIRKGLRAEIAKMLECDPTIISHGLKTARKYLEDDPNFREQMNSLFSKMIG